MKFHIYFKTRKLDYLPTTEWQMIWYCLPQSQPSHNIKFGANIVAKVSLNKNNGRLGNKVKRMDPCHLALHSEKSTFISLLDQYERIVANARSLALTYEIEWHNICNFSTNFKIKNNFSILIDLNNKFFTDTINRHSPQRI